MLSVKHEHTRRGDVVTGGSGAAKRAVLCAWGVVAGCSWVAAGPAARHGFIGRPVQAVTAAGQGLYSAGAYDAGLIDPIRQPLVIHTFGLHYTGRAPLTVTRLASSCSCTSALLDKPVPAVLRPGETVRVSVSVDVASLGSGSFEKRVWAYSPGRSMPVAAFTFRGTVRPLVWLAPNSIDFGSVRAGGKLSAALVLTIDRRLVTALGWPRIASSDPRVTVVPIVPAKALAQAKGYLSRMYRAEVTTCAAVGALAGKLQLAPARGAPDSRGAGAGGTVAFGGAFQMAVVSAPFKGAIVGPFRAVPEALSFGPVAANSHSGMLVTVHLAPSLATKPAVQVQATGRGVACRVIPAGEAHTIYLMVTLEGAAPGPLDAQIRVQCSAGPPLVIPVSAYVMSPSTTVKDGK